MTAKRVRHQSKRQAANRKRTVTKKRRKHDATKRRREVTRTIARTLCAIVAERTYASQFEADRWFSRITAAATTQQLQPEAFMTPDGEDALRAIAQTLAPGLGHTIHLTGEWRRIVVTARQMTKLVSARHTGDPNAKYVSDRDSLHWPPYKLVLKS